MVRKSQVLVLSLLDEKTKRIGHIMSNASARKIVEFMQMNPTTTESELASQLSIPISTVHYNLQQLQEIGLVDSDEFTYSKKGKKINHYKLTHPYILISPTELNGVKQKLRSVLPVGLILTAGAGVFYALQRFVGSRGTLSMTSYMEAESPARTGTDEAASSAMDDAVAELAQSEAVHSGVREGLQKVGESMVVHGVIWFIVGVIAALGLYLLVSYVRKD